jgi:hypothetical protein
MATRLFRSAEKEHGGRKTTVEDITLLGDCASLFGQMRRKERRVTFVSAVSVRRFSVMEAGVPSLLKQSALFFLSLT